MKKLKLFFACLLMAVLSIGQVWAVDITFGWSQWDGVSGNFSGQTKDEVTQTVDDVVVTYTRNGSSLYANSSAIRFYGSNTLKFEAPTNYKISSIVIAGSSFKDDVTTDVATCTSSASALSWEGEASSVTFTRTGTSYITMTGATVTLKSSTPAVAYTVSFNVGGSSASQADITEASAGAGIELPAGPAPTCSADGWTFAGWKETSAVSPQTTTAPTLLSAGGTYHPTDNVTLYAVYKKTEAGGGSTTKSMTSFDAISGNVENDANVSYAAAQGTAGTAPAVNNNEIRIYQNGGLLTITANNGVKLNSITIGSSMVTKVTYAVDGGSASSDNDIAKNGTFTVDELDATEVVFTCTGTDKSSRLYLNNLSVTYSGGGTTYYLSAPSCTPPAVADPVISLTEGEYEGAQSGVTITCATDGAEIYYTTDDSDPTSSSIHYTGAISINASQTIKAIAIKGTTESNIVSAEYTIITTCETPTFSLAEGSYEGTQTVEISSTRDGVTIYYTTDGSDPTNTSSVYSSALSVSSTQTIKAIATKSTLENSAIASATYTITAGPDVTLDFLDGNWSFPTSYQTTEGVFTNSVTSYAVTCYGTGDNGFKVTDNYLIIGKQDAYIQLPAFSNPVAKIVTLKGSGDNPSGSVIMNIYDGETAASTAVQGCATDKEFIITNPKVNNQYTLKITSNHNLQIAGFKIYFGEAPAVEQPTINGNAAFVGSQDVTISCGTEGAAIYYTTDPDKKDNPDVDTWSAYSTKVTINSTCTLYAAAIKGSDWSAVAEKSFTATPLYTSIAALQGVATTTETTVFVKMTDWMVTGVSGSNAYVTDGTGYGIILYKYNHGFAVGDKLNKAQLETTLQFYTDGGFAELKNLSTADFSGEGELVQNAEITPIAKTATEFAALTVANQGALFVVNNLTYDATNSKFVDANANEIAYYNKFGIEEALVDGHTYNVTGVAVYHKTGDVVQLCPRAAADLVDNTAYVQISFNANTTETYTGDLPATVTNHISGTDYTVPAASLARTDGYYQLGWNTDPAATVALATLTNVTANQTLYAVWKETDNCTITFYSNGQEYDTKVVAQSAAYDFAGIVDPTAQGYTFAGWSESEISGEEASATILDSYTPTASTKDLYAVFSRKVDGTPITQYEKVTTAPASWEGEYLLVYENSATEGYVWDGTDNSANYKTATIASNAIAEVPTGAATLTIAAYSTGHSILINGGTNDGKYLNGNGKNTGLLFGDNADVVTISCKQDGTELLFTQRSIRYMDGRFRFYADDKDLAWLYRKNTVIPQSDVYTTAPVIRYTVSFALVSGESGTFNDISVVKGENAELPTAVPTKVHYTFNKWSDGVNEYAAGATIENVTADIELHATWTEKAHATVSYNLNGAPGSIAPVEVYAGEDYNLEAAPVWSDNIFKGWKTGDQVYTAGAQMTMGETPAAIEYEAQWAEMLPIPASVPTFNNGVWVKEGDVANLQAGDYVMIVALNDNQALAPNKNSSTNRGAKAITKIATMTDSVLTYTDAPAFLFLQNGMYDGHFGLYNMNLVEAESTNGAYLCTASASNNMKTQTIMNENSSWKIEITDGVASIVAKESSNYNVMQYNPNTGGNPLFSCYNSASQKALTIYRFQEGKNLYKVDYKVNETIVKTVYTITDAITVETIDEKATWTDGENHYTAGTEIALTENLVLTYEVPVYTVTFNSNEGSAVAPVDVEEGQTVAEPTPAPTKEGYRFVEWQLGGNTYDFATPVTAAITLDAEWQKVWTVTFNSDGGSAVDPALVDEGQPVAAPTSPTKDNYNFVKWQLNGEDYNFATPVTADITLDAVWAPVMYTVTFNSNEGSAVNPVNVAHGQTVTKPANPTKTGYRFVEWQLNSVAYDFATPVTADIELEAVWQKVWTVSFNSNGGSEIGNIVVDEGQPVAAPTSPTKDNYDFVEWQLGGVAYDFTTPVTDDITLDAVWDAIPAPVTYVAKIGETMYESLPAAVAAAQDGQKVELIMDVAAGPGVMITTAEHKQIIIDFGNHTYCAESPAVGSAGTQNQAFHFEKGCDITLQNGTITSSGNEIIMLIQNYGDLTLKNITLIGNNLPGTHRYVLSNNCGNVVIGEGTTITAKEGDVAFDVCVTNYYPEGARVTVEEGATITGIVEYDVWGTIPADNKATLTIEGGSFNITWNVEPALAEDAKDNINVEGGTFTAPVPNDYCAHGYIPEDNGSGQYGVYYAGYYERGSLTPGNYATICLPRAGKISGASLFDIEYYENSTLYLLEVEGNAMVAGRPYIFLPSVEKIEVIYTDAVDATAGSFNGLVGSLSLNAEVIPANDGNYILSNNQYWYVNSLAYVGANRAYIHMASVPTEPSTPQVGQAPRRRVAMNVNGEQVATGVDALNASEKPMKLMINGQLFILRGEKMYDVKGQLVK